MIVCCARLSSPLSATITTRYSISLSHNFPNHAKVYYSLKSFTRSKCSHAEVNNKTKKNRNFAISSNSSVPVPSDDFVVVNFYRFVFIKNPHDEVAKNLSFLQDLDINGRIYLNEQGINAQFSGPSKDALAYVEWLKEDIKFSDILVQVSPAFNGHAFPKLKLRYKSALVQTSLRISLKELVLFAVVDSFSKFVHFLPLAHPYTTLEGGISHLPLLNPQMRATPLTPSEWRKRLEAAHEIDVMSNSSIGSNYVLLDVRNGYEWDIGHFVGAQRPVTDCFRSTSCGLSNREVIASDPLANADKNTTNIFMYCTGGIRCDVYSTILRQQGFQNLYTLMGGVSHYLNVEGPREWIGNLFVFDDRLSLPPPAYNPDADSNTTTIVDKAQGPKNYSFANCYICGSHVHELRHRNCANIDCNLLFLCCINCVKNFRGCCCLKCKTAHRLRPVLPGNQRYKKWHTYRELEVQSKLIV